MAGKIKRPEPHAGRPIRDPSPAEGNEILKTRQATERKRQRTRARTAQFYAAHKKGMAALQRQDYDALGKAIADERALIEEHQADLFAGLPSKPSTGTRKRRRKRKAG